MNTPQPPTPITLLNLEDKLLADHDGTYRTQLKKQLETLEEENNRRLRSLLPQDEYAQRTKLQEALQKAQIIIDSCCKTTS